jgi:hypothetical protein
MNTKDDGSVKRSKMMKTMLKTNYYAYNSQDTIVIKPELPLYSILNVDQLYHK